MKSIRFGGFLDRLSDRERKLVALCGLFIGLFALFMVVFWISNSLRVLAETNTERTDLLSKLEQRKDDLLLQIQEEKRYEKQYSSEIPPLRSLLSNTARNLNLMIPDLKELPDQNHGERWVEHSMEVRLNSTNLAPATNFMVAVEAYRKQFPISITKLDVEKRRGQPDTYDFKLTVSTYERKAEEAGKDAKPGKEGKESKKDEGTGIRPESSKAEKAEAM